MQETDHPETQQGAQGQSSVGHFPAECIEETEAAYSEIKVESMTAIVSRMAVSDKIKLALIGNKEARGLLIKDTNKAIVKNVLDNPRITDDEAIMYASNRNLSSEVPRILANKRQFLKIFKVRCALVKNPKTPVPQALKLLPALPEHVLKEIARSTGVAGVVKSTARRLLTQRGRA
jgi:hypothetical protein